MSYHVSETVQKIVALDTQHFSRSTISRLKEAYCAKTNPKERRCNAESITVAYTYTYCKNHMRLSKTTSTWGTKFQRTQASFSMFTVI